MPRREGVDALGLPIIPASSRSRPGSSNAPYPHGGAAFAGSSSSLVNTRAQAISEPNLAAFVVPSPGPGMGPVSANDAPHLSTTESFFGRMTLTAPDNMRRKKAEEREKKKQVRKRRAERGANAAASIANPQDIGPSHMPQQSATTSAVASGMAAAAEPSPATSRRRKRPTLPTSNSGSALQTYTLEQSRSRSPTRPVRSQSAQNSQTTSRQASPERRQVRQRNRGISDASAGGSVVAAAPTYQHASESEGVVNVRDPQTTTQQLASLPSAAQQRRDIYADLDSLGLPGADESDLEDQPPPFPAYATRPISPPRMPVDGEEWTDDMRRRQEEYEMNRPPDSPPPAFRSDDETRPRAESEPLSSSDEESLAGDIGRERKEWEEDVAAGFSLEERIERDRLRREAKEGSAVDDDADADAAAAVVAPLENQVLADEDLPLQIKEVEEVDVVPEVLPVIVPEEQEMPKEQQVIQEADLESAQEPLPAQDQQRPQDQVQEHAQEQQQPQMLGSPSNPLNLGKLVMEARARRASTAKRNAEEMELKSSQKVQSLQDSEGLQANAIAPVGRSLAAILQSNASLPALGTFLPIQSVTSRLLQDSASQSLQGAASQPSYDVTVVQKEVSDPKPVSKTLQAPSSLPSSANHARIASEGSIEQATTTPKAIRPARKKKVASTASVPISKVAKKSSHQEEKLAPSIKIQPRPSGQSHSCFRDGASAAANRRMVLWGPSAPTTESTSIPEAQETAKSGGIIPGSYKVGDVQMDEDPIVPSSELLRQRSSSDKSALTSAQESGGEVSSDSDGKWEKEEAAFEALQRKSAPPAVIGDDSSEEEEIDNREIDQRSDWFRSNSIDLAKPGSSVPRAPPPLVLGRSRGGGAEYSSSSESSSESGANRMDDDSDDSLSPIEVEDISSQGRPSFSTSDRLSVKGKEPVRPSFVEADRTMSAPMPSASTMTTRAGEFEEDSGSSRDFASDDGEQDHMEGGRGEGIARPLVGNRLKTLFSMPLNNSSQTPVIAPSAAARASIGNLFEKQIDATPSLAAKKPTQSFAEVEETPSLSQQSSEKSLRAKEWAQAYATLEKRQQRDSTDEQQARLEALEQISRLQLAGTASNSTSSVNHDSLSALERLLSRRSFVPSIDSQPDEDRRATLRRSGAINRTKVAAPFVNPRSSIAPRPLGRLPTITNATRHFPPSRQATEEPSSNAPPGPSLSSFTPRDRRSVMEPANWMTHIPDSERRALPEPLEPVKKRQEISSSGLPPPLPIRSANNRVSAMIERFEGQSTERSTPRSPSKEQIASVMPLPEDISRDDSLRRRPPPPPPPRLSRPISVTMPSMPPSSPFLPSSSSQGEDLSSMPVKPFKPPFLQGYIGSQIPGQSTIGPPPLSHSPPLPFHQSSPRIAQPALPPRIRARPLPIPPHSKPVASTSAESMQQHQPQSQEIRQEERKDEDSDSDEEYEESASPPRERSSTSSLPTAISRAPTREASLGYTDLELFASRLADEAPADGAHYEDLHLIAEFLGPAKSMGATAEEVEALSVGVIEVLRKRVVGKKENGRDKIKISLQLMGVKVERCGVCLFQFKEGNLACLFPCLHVLHEECATKLLRNTKRCPTCREPISM